MTVVDNRLSLHDVFGTSTTDRIEEGVVELHIPSHFRSVAFCGRTIQIVRVDGLSDCRLCLLFPFGPLQSIATKLFE